MQELFVPMAEQVETVEQCLVLLVEMAVVVVVGALLCSIAALLVVVSVLYRQPVVLRVLLVMVDKQV
jgi:hypothetical protein